MADGGMLRWKVQTIDQSRGPPGNYSSIYQPLPKPPSGVTWHKDAMGEWSLVREDHGEKSGRKYTLEVGEVWDGSNNRAAPTLVPVPVGVDREHKQKQQQITTDGSTNTCTDVNNSHEKNCPHSQEHDHQHVHEPPPPEPPIEGVHYVLHTVLPTDTFSGLCLRYKIPPHLLRRSNRFSGSNLQLAPHQLLIPLNNGEGLKGGSVARQNRECPEVKVHDLQGEFPSLKKVEIRAYLDMADGKMEAAREAIQADEEWERMEEKKRRVPRAKAGELAEEKHRMWDVGVAVPADGPGGDAGAVQVAVEGDVDGGGGLTEPLLRHCELPSRRTA